MAEYVDKVFVERMLMAITDNKELITDALNSLPIANVVEREKIDDSVEEIHLYKHGNGNMFDRGMMKALGIFMKNIEGIEGENDEVSKMRN